uniref:Uncharacterized protein n=1 Tax=Zea mays TaxID=4577 RepID=C0P6X4_MAIZE|nr:unknown [Zea mays]
MVGVHALLLLRQLHGGRHAHQGLPQPGEQGGGVPQEPADAALLQPVERGRLGDAGRARQDGLVPRPLLRLLPRVQGRRLRRRRGRPDPLRRHRRHRGHRRPRLRRRRRGLVQPGAGPHPAAADALGAAQVHDLQLLHRPQALPAGPPRRVLHAVAPGYSSPVQQWRARACVCMWSALLLPLRRSVSITGSRQDERHRNMVDK